MKFACFWFRFNLLIILSLSIILLLETKVYTPCFAASYYVRTDGNNSSCNGQYDADSGSAPNCAYATVSKAASAVASGDTVTVGNGTYNEPGRIDITASGADASHVITLRAANKNLAIVNQGFYVTGSYVTIDGFRINGPTDPFFSTTGSHNTFTNNYCNQTQDITGVFGQVAVAIRAGSYNTASYNYMRLCQICFHSENGTDHTTFLGNEINGVQQWGNSDADYMRGWGDTILVKGNYFHGPHGSIPTAHMDCFQNWFWPGAVAKNITFDSNWYESCADGINQDCGNTDSQNANYTWINNVLKSAQSGFTPCDVGNVVMINNTFYDVVGAGVACESHGYGGPATFQNNIFYGSARTVDFPYSFNNCSGTADHNLMYNYSNMRPLQTGDINADPKFTTNFTNFQLQSTSPAVGAGTNFYPSFTTDKVGTTRPSSGPWDIGAYQKIGMTAPSNLRIVSP